MLIYILLGATDRCRIYVMCKYCCGQDLGLIHVYKADLGNKSGKFLPAFLDKIKSVDLRTRHEVQNHETTAVPTCRSIDVLPLHMNTTHIQAGVMQI